MTERFKKSDRKITDGWLKMTERWLKDDWKMSEK